MIGPTTGRAWRFGDAIDTDLLAPGPYMKLPPAELAQHCLETIAPGFAAAVRPGDVVIAGERFGLGSAREQAADSLQRLGIAAVLARSFGRIFQRNAFNLGLPALPFADTAAIADGDTVRLDLAAGRLANLTRGTDHPVPLLPSHLAAIVAAGGLIGHLKQHHRNRA